MPRVHFPLLCLMALGLTSPAYARDPSIRVEPRVVAPGESVTFRLNVAASRVVVSGGRFKRGADVTGQTALTDQPTATTRYTIDVWPAVGSKTKKPASPSRQIVTVRVSKMPNTSLSLYRSLLLGWQVQYPRGWQRDHVSIGGAGQDGLVYFQKEEDSIERLCVAVVPTGEITVDELCAQIVGDMRTRYENLDLSEPTEMRYQNAPALWLTFKGIPTTHPGVPTQSMVLMFVRNGRSYVITSRTNAGRFEAQRSRFEKLIKSFQLNETTVKDA